MMLKTVFFVLAKHGSDVRIKFKFSYCSVYSLELVVGAEKIDRLDKFI
jgi:hypothetical protein